jgi:anti-sigma factor RsiW
MTSLRDHVRKALATREPNEPDARRDLETVLERAERRPRPRWPRVAVTAFALAGVVLCVYVARPRSQSASDMKLYVHIPGEPDSQALALVLTTRGDHR